MTARAFTIVCPTYAPPPIKSGEAGVRPRAEYDAARTTTENEKHWTGADDLSARSQNTPGVRKILRNRARYETQNNTYAAGLIRTLVTDTIGRGPRLRMMTPDKSLNTAVQTLWREWAAASDFALNCRLLAGTRYVAGECFGVLRDSKKLDRMGLPSLDLRLIEPDQVADPTFRFAFRSQGDDGVNVDDDGEVVSYSILKAHPGDSYAGLGFYQADTVPAENVLHWFQPDRPGQLRGVTPLTPALPIFAQLRRFTSATLTAAEVAAMLAGVMEVPEANFGAEQTSIDNWTTIELVRGTLLTLPGGAKASQFKPEQPTTNYEMFVNAKLRECGRMLCVPFGKMAGDHSRYNYSSGKLDDNQYWADREVERQSLEAKAFNPFFYRWLEFAKFFIPALAAYQGKYHQLAHVWHYDARPTADAVKDATGDELNLTNGTDSPQAICERDGSVLEQVLDERAEAKRMYEERGLDLPPWLTGGVAPARQTEQPQPVGGVA